MTWIILGATIAAIVAIPPQIIGGLAAAIARRVLCRKRGKR